MTRSETPRLLLVDDDAAAVGLLAEVFERAGYRPATATSLREALDRLRADGPVDLVVTDLRMPGGTGLELLEIIRDRHPGTIVIVLTAFGDTATAADAIRAGAHDFISKPFDIEELRAMIARALDRRVRAASRRPDAAPPPGSLERGQLVGRSAPMIEVMKTIARVARTRASVLITGETGTGKELVARTLHQFSDRSAGGFVPVNCSALAEGVLESELFGHVKGSFTGAVAGRGGLIREAHGGTLFLDEIGDVSAGVQTRLLRVLQEKEVLPVGSDRAVPVDVRLVAATHRDLAGMVQAGAFREDLYYRLNVVTIHLPSLRERRQDIPLLIDHFLRQLARRHGRGQMGLDREAEARLLDYAWPGNVRQLINVLERSLVVAAQDVIGLEHLPDEVRSAPGPVAPPAGAVRLVPLAQVEREHVLHVLDACGGNRERSAAVLGISRRTLTRMLQRWRGAGVGGGSP